MKFINHNNEIVFSDNYKATAIPAHVIGCEGYFNLFDTNTNMKVGRLEGETAEIKFESDITFMPTQLIEIAKLTNFIHTFF